MSDFRIKLISLPLLCVSAESLWNEYNRGQFTNSFLPYGLGVITQFLKSNDYNVVLDDISARIKKDNRKLPFFVCARRKDTSILLKKTLDYLYSYSCAREIEQFAEQITQITSCEGYDLVGITIPTVAHFFSALLLVKKLKSIRSMAKIVFGGPYVTLYGKGIYTQSYYGDYMIVGDGQIPLLRLIEHLEGKISIDDVPNLLYRQDGSVRENPRKLFPLEDLHIPDYSDLSLEAYWAEQNKLTLFYQITRGCAHRCGFCQLAGLNKLEFKSRQKVVRELKTMKEEYSSNYFFFCDGAINCSYEYLDKLCDMFIEERLGISWVAFARADNLNKKILHKMKKAGCVWLHFGIESGSNRILKMMNKNFSIEQASQVLKDSHQEGIANTISLIAGYPHEREEDIVMTIRFIKENAEYINLIGVFPLVLTYGTPLYANPEKFGLENLRPDFAFVDFAFDEINGLKWKEKIKQQEYSIKRLKKANFQHILSKKYRVTFIPFWLYSFFYNMLPRFYNNWVFRLFERFLLYLRRDNKKWRKYEN